MNCTDVQEALSAYFDGELSADLQLQVFEHLEHCSDCGGQLTRFGKLSALVAEGGLPNPPGEVWYQLERLLNESPVANSRDWWRRRTRPTGRVMALAASVLLVVFGGWFVGDRWFSNSNSNSNPRQLAAEFGDYLDEFQRDPAAAQQLLLAKYENRSVSADEAIHHVGYRPALAKGLPEGYAIDATHIVKMPCCTCVQTLCRRADGSSLAIFEHEDDVPPQFDDRPGTIVECHGTECCMVELDNQIAATWQREGRHIAVVGVRDANEVEKLVAWLDN